MRNTKKPVEQRKLKRFQVWDDAFVLLGPDSTKLGAAIDISTHGLSFSHIGRKAPSSELFELDLFLIDRDFYLERVPFKTVWDVQTEENPFSSITMRRCGVKFGELTNTQVSQLGYFIQNHATAKALNTYSTVKKPTQGRQQLYG